MNFNSSAVLVMGVINVSAESFFKGSVKTKSGEIRRAAERMGEDGADMIDVGAMSTAPYLKTEISEAEETDRLGAAVSLIRKATSLPISVDTSRKKPADAGRREGAVVLNDVHGLRKDPELALLAPRFKKIILMAHPLGKPASFFKSAVNSTHSLLRENLARARKAGIPRSKIILDPGLGFFRTAKIPWWKWDVDIIKNLSRFESLGCPLLLGISRKSFLGHLLGGRPPEERLSASLAATTVAVLNGVSIMRTHDVRETKEAVKIAMVLR